MRRRHRWAPPLLLLCALAPVWAAHAEGVPVSQATDEQKSQAQELFIKATEKMKGDDHEGALADLRGSFDIVASPNTRLLIMRELIALGRPAEAYREAAETERLAEEAALADPKYQDTLKSVQQERADLGKKVGFVKVDVGTLTGELVVGGRAIGTEERGGAIAVNPGQVEVAVRGPTGVADTRVVDVGPGVEVAVSFVPVVKPEEPKTASGSVHPFDMGTGQRITGIVFAGVGVIGMGMFAGFGSANQAIYSDLEEQCASGSCPSSLQEDADQGRTWQTAANVSVVIGAVGLAAGAGLLIPTFFAKKKSDDKSAWLGVEVGPGYVGYKGSF
ncbi:MAG: hypothetical protein IPG04_23005 [Polyangiaceae bacterium]|nr:hypothetical protein [Polyangiaceae bacterium]